MTREEAIDKLQNLWNEVYNEDSDGYTYAVAIDMAIEALKGGDAEMSPLQKPTTTPMQQSPSYGADFISRADAIKAVHKYFMDLFNDEPHETDEDGDEVFTDMKSVNTLLNHNKAVSKAIKALPSADRPSGEWIPCETSGMPPEGKSVLMSDGNRIWIDETVAWWGDRSDWIGTAWMPLPTPYKGDDTE